MALSRDPGDALFVPSQASRTGRERKEWAVGPQARVLRLLPLSEHAPSCLLTRTLLITVSPSLLQRTSPLIEPIPIPRESPVHSESLSPYSIQVPLTEPSCHFLICREGCLDPSTQARTSPYSPRTAGAATERGGVDLHSFAWEHLIFKCPSLGW